MKRYLVGAAVVFAVFACSIASYLFGGLVGLYSAIPQCPEDSVLVGIGSFVDGRWDNYFCGPALDDFGG